jgi:hypothetical protein
MPRTQRLQTLAVLCATTLLVPLLRPWLLLPCALATVIYAQYLWTTPPSPRAERRVPLSDTDARRILRSAARLSERPRGH